MDRDELIEAAADLEVLGIDLCKSPERHKLVLRRDLIVNTARMLDAPRINPVLVGEVGVGKTSIVRALAEAMATRNNDLAPSGLHGRSIILVTTSDLVCGALYANQLEHKLQSVAKNCRTHKAILFLCEPLGLIGSGASVHDPDGDVASLIVPYLRHGSLRVIAAATPDAWMMASKRKPGFTGLFTPVIVPAMTWTEAHEVLKAKGQDWQARFRRRLPAETREEALSLAERLYPARMLPGRVTELIETALAGEASDTSSGRPGGRPGAGRRTPPPLPVNLTPAQLSESVRRATGLPRFLIVASQPATSDSLLQGLRWHVKGQDHVLKVLVERIQMIKARLCAPGRPLGSYLLAGPTGVGKTLVARSLAALVLGDERRLLRFDMSEYQEPDSVERFVGENGRSRPAVGLVDAALSAPMPVILLDEIEKAHSRVFDVLLQVLGEGRLTDARGRTALFSNALVLMTSNLGSHRPVVDLPRPAECQESWERRVQEAVTRFFRPEFVNRLTGILTFAPLSAKAVEAVARRELEQMAERKGVASRRLKMELTTGAMRQLLEQGYSERQGARPMQRAVDSLVGECVGELIAEHPETRDRSLVIDWSADLEEMHIMPGQQKLTG